MTRISPAVRSHRILFLDMDGVVNSLAFFSSGQGRMPGGPPLSKRAAKRARGKAKAEAHKDHAMLVDMIDPAAVVHLNAILDATGALVVLSSSWRIPWPFTAVEAALVERGFTGKIIDRTPPVGPSPPAWDSRPDSEWRRGLEIAAWLAEHPEVEAFAILDDSDDMAHLLPKLVQTTWDRGLEAEHVELAVTLLTNAALPGEQRRT